MRVEIDEFRSPVATLHGSLIEMHRGEILDRDERERRRALRSRSLWCSRRTRRTVHTPLGLVDVRSRRDEVLASVVHSRCSGAIGATIERTVRAAQHARRICASIYAGHDPQNGQ
jgi:hypothetical protein